MAIKKVKISELPKATNIDNLKILGVDGNNQSVQAEMDILRGNDGQSAFEQWRDKAGNAGKSFNDFLAYLRQPANDAAEALGKFREQTENDLANLAQQTAEAAADAEKAAGRANEVAAHPPYIGNDYYVYVYDTTAKTYRRTDVCVKGDSAYQLWLKEPGNFGKTYEEYLTYNRQPAIDAANSLAAEIGMLTDGMDTLAGDISRLDLRKADGAFVEEGFLYLTSQGEVISDGIELPAGGGSGPGGGGGSLLRLKNLGESILGAPKGASVVLHYNFTSVDAEDQSPTGAGTVAYYVNSLRVLSQSISQGDNSIDISRYLTTGQNEVRVQVTDSYGAIRSIYIRVEVVDLVIRSTFDDSVPYEGDIIFPYTPVGNGSKTIHFLVDGIELPEVVTTVTNRQLYYTIERLSHGNHSLQVYATMELNGVIMRSNDLYFDIIALGASGTPIISSAFVRTTAEQYEVLNIPYTVYTPGLLNSKVVLKANDEEVATLTVDRKAQVWSYRINHYGPLTLDIISGEARKTFRLDVSKSSIDTSAETENLELWLTANGRSNNEAQPETWNFETINARLSGFNFKTNGWVLDQKGVTVLRVSSGASVDIPFQPFTTDFKTTGKTLEFEFTTHSVENFDAVVVSCMSGGRGFRITAQEAFFSSELSNVSTKFKEEEHIRLSFVVENRLRNRLIYIYINGVMSGTIRYAENDDFRQLPPVNIQIGSPDCTVDIYNIRSYNTDLNQYQVLNNYISDLGDITEKLAIYTRNQIFDPAGEIVFSLLLDQLPCMLITGTLPTRKGDKQTVSLTYENRQDITKSFSAEGVEIDVQGTSSQYYPRKNFKTKFKQGLVMTESGEALDTYLLTDEAIPVAVFCEKADFAESSGTHNTGMARIVDRVLREMDILTPPQRENNKVRTTVDGFPIAIFHRESPEEPIQFVGKYNFNNDKSTQETYGFDGADECWEFLNNATERCLFKSADFTGSEWLNDFEGRYPDANDNPANLSKLVSWVVSCHGNPAKFRDECEEHFNLRNLLSYYLVSELFGMVDQRAKNMMMASWGNEGGGEYKWYFIFYDNDTVLGINNEGANVFGFDIEAHDTIGSGHVWNGHDSELWRLVEDAYPDELKAMYDNMRQSGAISYDKAIAVLNGEQSDKWCEVVYNMDGQYKYIDPLVDDKNESYLYALQGSRTEHRKWWLRNRFLYLDSKYVAGDFLTDYVTMRIYTPSEWGGVKPNADFDLTLYKDAYVNVKYSSYIVSQRGKANQTIHIEPPATMEVNDTETIIYGIQAVKALGDLSAKYPGTVDISKARKLTELVIGSAAEGYRNENLHSVGVGNSELLRKVDVRNCPGLTEPLDVSGCSNIEEILCEGTSLSSVTLPPAGILRLLTLPATISNLTLKNQANLTDAGLVLAGKTNISTLVLEHMTSIDTLQLVKDCLAVSPLKLNRLRLIGIDWQDTDLSILAKLYEIGGVDENEKNVPHAIITGKLHADQAFGSEIETYRTLFPELEITASRIVEDPVVTFEFISNMQKPLENCSFECNFAYTKLTDTSYSVKAPTGAEINLTFKADNHDDVKETYIVTNTRTRQYTAIYIPLRTIQVVDDTGVPVPGATVIAFEKEYTADAEGKVYIRGRDTFEIRAFAEDYGENITKIYGSNNDSFHQVKIYPYMDFRFIVTDRVFGVLLPGAVIECNGITKRTDDNGEALFRLTAGFTHYYSAYYGDNEVYKNSVYPSITQDYQEIKLTTTIDEIRPTPDGSIQLLYYGSYPLQFTIATEGTSAFVIDWGDGTTSNATGNTNDSYTHAYTKRRCYSVSISNCSNINDINLRNLDIYAIWSIGNSKLANLDFRNLSYLKAVGPDLFKNDTRRTSFKEVFISCNQLREIPVGLFDGCEAAVTFEGAFRGCNSVKEIPESLFADCIKAKSFYYTFFACANLTTIPGNLFANAPLAESFSYCFQSCGLKEIPGGLFKYNPKATDLSYCFYYNSNLTAIPENLFVGCTAVANLNYAFAKTSIRSIPENLFAPLTNLARADYLFSDCTNLLSIPEGLFSNNFNLYSLKYIFSGCTRLVSIPSNLFPSLPNITYIERYFSRCSALENIPEDLLTPFENLKTIDGLFWGCTNLVSIPEGLFKDNVEITSLESVFRECSSLASIPSKLFSSLSKLTRLYQCFCYCSSIKVIPEDLFYNNLSLDSFSGVFENCNSLQNIPGNLFSQNVQALSFWNCFSSCKELESVPSRLFADKPLATDFAGIFDGCSKLKTVPSDILSGSESVSRCDSFFRATAIDEVPDGLFANCPNINSINHMFRECTSLKHLKKEFLTSLSENISTSSACYKCTSLEYAEIPTVLTNLGNEMFRDCTNLAYVETFTDIPPAMGSYVFYNTNNCPIYVPDAAVDAYKQAEGWTAYADRILPKSMKP